MKFKASFITNSSSSSFILAHFNKDQKLGKVKIEIEIDLDSMISMRLSSLEDINNYLYEDDITNEIKEIINAGGELLLFSAKNASDDPIEKFLSENGINNIEFGKDFKVIQGDGGY